MTTNPSMLPELPVPEQQASWPTFSLSKTARRDVITGKLRGAILQVTGNVPPDPPQYIQLSGPVTSSRGSLATTVIAPNQIPSKPVRSSASGTTVPPMPVGGMQLPSAQVGSVSHAVGQTTIQQPSPKLTVALGDTGTTSLGNFKPVRSSAPSNPGNPNPIAPSTVHPRAPGIGASSLATGSLTGMLPVRSSGGQEGQVLAPSPPLPVVKKASRLAKISLAAACFGALASVVFIAIPPIFKVALVITLMAATATCISVIFQKLRKQ